MKTRKWALLVIALLGIAKSIIDICFIGLSYDRITIIILWATSVYQFLWNDRLWDNLKESRETISTQGKLIERYLNIIKGKYSVKTEIPKEDGE